MNLVRAIGLISLGWLVILAQVGPVPSQLPPPPPPLEQLPSPPSEPPPKLEQLPSPPPLPPGIENYAPPDTAAPQFLPSPPDTPEAGATPTSPQEGRP